MEQSLWSSFSRYLYSILKAVDAAEEFQALLPLKPLPCLDSQIITFLRVWNKYLPLRIQKLLFSEYLTALSK